MVKVESDVTINQPVNTVFDWVVGYFAQNLQQWSPGVQQIQQLTPGPIGLGTTFHQVRTIQGKPVPTNSEVVELQPPYRFVLQSQGQDQRAVASYTFQAVGPSTTNLKLEINVEGGFPKMAGPMVSRQIKKDTEEDLGRLKSILRG